MNREGVTVTRVDTRTMLHTTYTVRCIYPAFFHLLSLSTFSRFCLPFLLLEFFAPPEIKKISPNLPVPTAAQK